jgi:hypothetical protein
MTPAPRHGPPSKFELEIKVEADALKTEIKTASHNARVLASTAAQVKYSALAREYLHETQVKPATYEVMLKANAYYDALIRSMGVHYASNRDFEDPTFEKSYNTANAMYGPAASLLALLSKLKFETYPYSLKTLQLTLVEEFSAFRMAGTEEARRQCLQALQADLDGGTNL